MTHNRKEWIENRLRQPNGIGTGRNVTQMHYARQGVVTVVMRSVGIREK